MMVDADLAEQQGARPADDASRFVTGVTGQDGSYLAERLLAEGVEVHAPGARRGPPAARPARRGRRCTRATSTDADGARARSSRDVGARRGLQPRRRSARWPARGQEPGAHRPGQRARPRSRCWSAARRLQERRGRAGARSCRRPAPRSSASPAASRRTRRTPHPPGQPVRRRQGLRPPHASASTAPRGLHAVERDPLQPRVAAPPDHLRHPQDHRDRGARSPAAGPTGSRWATSTPAATGAGRPTTSTRWSAPPAHDVPGDYVDRHRRRRTRVRDFVAAAFARAGDRRLGAAGRGATPTSSGRPTPSRARRRRHAWRATRLGWSPTVDFEEVVGRMVDAESRV